MNKEEFRLLHHKAANLNEDVMSRYYGINTNKNAPVRLDDVTLNRILDKHGKNGLTVMCFYQNENEESVINGFNDIVYELRANDYQYLPIYNFLHGKYALCMLIIIEHKCNYEGQYHYCDFIGGLCRKYGTIAYFLTQNRALTDFAYPSDASEKNLYVNPMPCCLSEMTRRNGEVMIWD